jgi:kynurenine formamidase
VSDTWYPSRWGEDDVLGALNEVTAAKVVEAARLVKTGRVYRLGHILEHGIPMHEFHGSFEYFTFRRHTDTLRKDSNSGGMNVRIEMPDHTGTHIDALNHVTIGERTYNGLLSKEITSFYGTSKLGMETTPPIVTRGVLVDIPAYKDVKRLDHGYLITPEEIEGSLRRAGTQIQKGDAVLIRTGWSQLWMVDNEQFSVDPPGIGLASARLLARQGASVVGSDTWNVEIDPAKTPMELDAVHKFLIPESGIRMIENLDLEEVGRDGVAEFLFVCLPLLVKGATGSPITPAAIV